MIAWILVWLLVSALAAALLALWSLNRRLNHALFKIHMAEKPELYQAQKVINEVWAKILDSYHLAAPPFIKPEEK